MNTKINASYILEALKIFYSIRYKFNQAKQMNSSKRLEHFLRLISETIALIFQRKLQTTKIMEHQYE